MSGENFITDDYSGAVPRMGPLDGVSKDLRILVVDDFPIMRRIVRSILHDLGFSNVCEAEDGRDALNRLKQQRFDLVISDWNMPNMMGIDLLRTIRAEKKFSTIPFIMITAISQAANVKEAVEAGVSNYIVKPFTSDTLERKIAAILAS